MLRGAPDDALINYVQNPTGHVPSYLALSELQRRKDMRAKYQQQQAPESSVADDLEQEATPQQAQGVASLPVPDDMYQDQNYASGGIVAFDDGGGVRYDDGSVGYPIGGLVVPVARAGLAAAKYGGKGLKYLKDKALVGKPAVTGPTMNLPTGPITPVLETATKGFLKTPGFYIDTAVVGGVLYGIDAYGNKERITEDEASKIATQKLEAENFKSMQDNTATREAREKAGADPNQKQVKYGDKPADTKANAPQAAQQPAESEDDFLRRRMAIYKEYMGGDEDKKGLKDKLDKMEARAARQEELAPWMALTEAGFKTMQGTSPYALSNFGAGAEAGIKSYGGAQDKMAALEEKRYALMNEAAKADRAERQAAITFGENSYQHKATMDQKDRIANMGADLKRDEIKLGYAKINSDANLLKSAKFGLTEQLAINKYVKDQMGPDALILENLRKLGPDKLDDKKKALLKTFTEKEARIKKEAIQQFNVNSLADRARPGSADTTYKSSDYTVEELPGL
jgi:hypothetical protein